MRAWMNDQEKERLGGDSGYNRVTTLVFEDSGYKRAASRSLTDGLRGSCDRRGQRGQMFAIQVAASSRVDQESVAPENHHGLDPFALREGPHEVVYGGQ